MSRTIIWIAPAVGMAISAATKAPNRPPTQSPSDAGVALMLPEPCGRADSPRSARIVAPLVIGAGVITELVVLGTINGSLSWAVPLVIVLAGGAAIALAFGIHGRMRLAVAGVALAALTAAPAT